MYSMRAAHSSMASDRTIGALSVQGALSQPDAGIAAQMLLPGETADGPHSLIYMRNDAR